LDELAIHFDNFNLRENFEIQGFNSSELFIAHMFSTGYGSSFINSTQFKERGGDNQNPLEVVPEKIHDDIDTLINTNDQYRKKGRTTRSGNPNSISTNVSQ
jgi:hypothetical protein